MLNKKNVLKFILGLKIRQLRARRKLSLKELADRAELSASYLNEIENGRKYPKIEKLAALAEALDVALEDLVSFKTGRNLHPLLSFLEGGQASKLPLEFLGLYEDDVVDLMGKDPEKFATFVLTILQLSRSFDMKLDDIYAATVRSLIELNDNYFPEMEKLARKIRSEWQLSENMNADRLTFLLQEHFGVTVDDQTFSLHTELRFQNYFYSEQRKKIFLNPELSPNQRKFYLAKVLGQLLLYKDGKISTELNRRMADFKTSYFADALLLEEKSFARELKERFALNEFKADQFKQWIEGYDQSIELIFHRMTQILPTHFKIFELFFLKMSETTESPPIMNKELHLSQLHRPHGVRMNETYCKRWVAIRSIQAFKISEHHKSKGQMIAQISQIDEGIEYFSLSYACRSSVKPELIQSYTIGFLINPELKKNIRFLNDSSLLKVTIGQTCERCPKQDCAERAAGPHHYQAQVQLEQRQKLLTGLSS